MAGSVVDSGLTWVESAVDDGCPDWQLQAETRQTLITVFRETREVGGPDAAGAVAEQIAARARNGRPPSATEARKLARAELQERGYEITMASPLARTSNG